ncbi:UDP-2,3-diacylglucosamine diphosphatase [Rhodothermus profundi]|uniref:UDP-2,3-diacylglucosamine hydrolase n=1 Tax=Rhodothermus profundi TaxID=633813 RepID=A0A1M6RPL6_9BACT|nr:UDP-2,3-diacylglucosamine diphosphatase [Rhodothermus profundi]SHK34422.1 UDP-2,3-diacylglucosamine hydrolase [Rhodothermus profundi]
MILFFADLHLGRADPATERAVEQSLLACLNTLAPQTQHLVLVGDVFHHYIEYRHLVPKGFVRFQALLARWTDRGLPVTYVVGNHDPWHQNYFAQELGVRVLHRAVVDTLLGYRVYLDHGDLAIAGPLSRALRRLLRHPVPVWLYRTLLPGDLGLALARRVTQWRPERLNPVIAERLRQHAHRVLQEKQADIVVLGHSHQAELHCWPEGLYLNPGCWYQDQTFGLLEANALALCRWTPDGLQTLIRYPLP